MANPSLALLKRLDCMATETVDLIEDLNRIESGLATRLIFQKMEERCPGSGQQMICEWESYKVKDETKLVQEVDEIEQEQSTRKEQDSPQYHEYAKKEKVMVFDRVGDLKCKGSITFHEMDSDDDLHVEVPIPDTNEDQAYSDRKRALEKENMITHLESQKANVEWKKSISKHGREKADRMVMEEELYGLRLIEQKLDVEIAIANKTKELAKLKE